MATILAQRMGDAPIVFPEMSERLGENINGPSLIAAPPWLTSPLGRYYLYFAHHDGHHLRLAYADALSGPWRIYEPGVLPLSASGFKGHIASPDAHVDELEQRIRLYFHGSDTPTDGGTPQWTHVALSHDGKTFEVRKQNLGEPYMRVVRRKDHFLALAMPGILYRSKDGLRDFERGPKLFDDDMRHAALYVEGDRLFVYYTQVGHAPERILRSEIDMRGEWHSWRESEAVTVLEPERPYEGIDAPLRASIRGIAHEPLRELRDPAIFTEGDDRYLLYSVAGERGIAIAKLL